MTTVTRDVHQIRHGRPRPFWCPFRHHCRVLVALTCPAKTRFELRVTPPHRRRRSHDASTGRRSCHHESYGSCTRYVTQCNVVYNTLTCIMLYRSRPRSRHIRNAAGNTKPVAALRIGCTDHRTFTHRCGQPMMAVATVVIFVVTKPTDREYTSHIMFTLRITFRRRRRWHAPAAAHLLK